MKLRKKFAIVLLVVTLLLSGVVYGQLEYTKQQSVDQVQTGVNETAALTAEQIDEEIKRQRDYVGYSASRPAASNFSNAHAFLEDFLSNPRFYAVQTIDETGTVRAFQGDILDSVRNETMGANLSDRAYVSVPLSTGKTYVSEPERLEGSNTSVIIIGAPIFEDGEITGVLAAAVELNRFSVFSTLAPLQTEFQSVSVHHGKTPLYESGRQFGRAVSGRATVPSTGWVVQVDRDRTPLESRLKRMALMQGGSLLLVLLVVVGLAAWEYQTTLKQTEQLLDGFEALRDGRYDHRLSLSAGEEWETIGSAFNELSSSLGDREQTIKEREEQLSVLNRVLRHNLRNDMTLILNYATDVVQKTRSQEVATAGEQIKERGRYLIGLAETARQVSVAMGMSEETVELDLAKEVRTAVDGLETTYPRTEIEMKLPEQAGVEVVPAFELAIENVVENALEHNDARDPTLEVSISRDEGLTTLSVADNGPGIPEEEWAALEGEEEPLEHGSGLGLWLIYWLVRKSDGSLTFEDNDPRGSVVTIEVPTAE